MLSDGLQEGLDEAVSPVVGVILMVAITVLLSAAVGAMVFDLGQNGQAIDTESSVSIDESGAGYYVTALTVGNPLEVRVNGDPIYNFTTDDVGDSTFVPASPGDQITVVSKTENGDVVLTSREASPGSAPDLIAYYTFEEQSGSTLVDHSGNGNDGDIVNATWQDDSHGTSLQFDGDGDYAHVPSLNVDETDDVKEFTIAVRYQITNDTGEVQQLVEHREDSTNFEWFLETSSSDPELMRYTVRPETLRKDNISTHDVHTVVGTFDGTTMHYYVNGTHVASTTNERTVSMGQLAIGADCCGMDIQYLEGNIYEIRLYYAALNEDEVQAVTEMMEK